jgi:hypothetical protein
MVRITRQLYKITFLYRNPYKYDTYRERLQEYVRTNPALHRGKDCPTPPELDEHTTYAAVNIDSPDDEIRQAVRLALRGCLGDDLGGNDVFIKSVEGLDTVFIEEERKQEEK